MGGAGRDKAQQLTRGLRDPDFVSGVKKDQRARGREEGEGRRRQVGSADPALQAAGSWSWAVQRLRAGRAPSLETQPCRPHVPASANPGDSLASQPPEGAERYGLLFPSRHWACLRSQERLRVVKGAALLLSPQQQTGISSCSQNLDQSVMKKPLETDKIRQELGGGTKLRSQQGKKCRGHFSPRSGSWGTGRPQGLSCLSNPDLCLFASEPK